MTTPQERAAAYWQQLASAEAQRRERERHTREMKVRPQYRVSANDEPEPLLPVRAFDERIAAEIRAERRGQP